MEKLDYELLMKLLSYSNRYEISIQFWPDQTTVFISKDGVDLESWGSTEKNFAILNAFGYLDRINRKVNTIDGGPTN